MIVRMRCTNCSVLIEEEIEELHQRLDDAVDWSIRNNHANNISIMCPECSEEQFVKLRGGK